MTQKLSDKKLAVSGHRKTRRILLRAYLKQELFSPKRVTATVKHAEKASALAKELACLRRPKTARRCMARTSYFWA